MRSSPFSLRLLLLLCGALLLAACGGSSSSTTTRTIAYTALGASDAVGIGALPLTKGYVFLLEERLFGLPADVTFQNEGISGAKIGTIVRDELPAALASDPDVVTIWTGANDLVGGADPDAFAAQLATLLSELTTNTAALIFVGDLPDLTQAPIFKATPDKDVTPARVTAFNDRIAATVAAAGCVLVRLSDVTLTDDMFFVDGFHPNNAGYVLLADAYWSEMAPRL